ncbi:hypothetical protein NDU88_001953 [Pleurodeles waltl]|uniref:Uncharacterized protein n=1 Tax=Pleurodeles waltl TaxID=8319 RepID=A0AAV7SBJ2_PLEWA|nr:hypothetical protein NDU88_001953 [Pleurodeles waltl]
MACVRSSLWYLNLETSFPLRGSSKKVVNQRTRNKFSKARQFFPAMWRGRIKNLTYLHPQAEAHNTARDEK